MWIEDYLYGKDLYQLLMGEKPKDMSETDWIVLDRKVLGVVCLSLSRNVALNIAKEKSTASLIEALANMYEKYLQWIRYILCVAYLIWELQKIPLYQSTLISLILLQYSWLLFQWRSKGINFFVFLARELEWYYHRDEWFCREKTLKFNNVKNLILSKEISRRELGLTLGLILNIENRGS